MKRVLVITHAGGSPEHGPNMRWYYLGQALKKMGVEVEIVSSSFFHKYASPPEMDGLRKTCLINGLIYHWLRTSHYNTRGLAQVLNQLEFVARCYQFSNYLVSREPDMVIASSPHPFVNFPALYIANKARARFVFEVRDLWPEVLLELGAFSHWHPYIIALSFAERFGVNNSERVISVKPGDGDYFDKKYKLSKSRFSYIPNGFLADSSRSSMTDEIKDIRGRYEFVVGYVGALSTYYGLDHLVELANHFRHKHHVGFMVIGKGDHLDGLRKKARNLGLEHFYFLGSISNSSVPSALALFDACYVGLQDIDVHRFGISCNKIYEYMYAGKPIIGSYRAGYDPVAEAKCGFVAAPGDYQPLIDGINRLMTQPELLTTLGKRARAYFDSHHDFRLVAEKLKETLF